MTRSADPVLDALARALGSDQVATRGAIDTRHLRDWVVPLTDGSPLALVRPRTTREVSDVLRACHASRTTVVPQGGLTGLVGGATPIADCVLLSLERMAGIEEIDDAAATMTVLAGTPLQLVQEAASKAGF